MTERIRAHDVDDRRHRALDDAFHLLSLPTVDPLAPARRLALIARLMARSGRRVGAAHHADLARRALPLGGGREAVRVTDVLHRVEDECVARVESGTPAGSNRPRRPRVTGLSAPTSYALGRAREALLWLDSTVETSRFTARWPRTVMIREARDSARLDGLPVALVELLHQALYRAHPTHVDSDLSPYLKGVEGPASPTSSPEPGMPTTLVLTHVRRLVNPQATAGARHAQRLGLVADAVHDGLLSRPVLPFTGWLADHAETFRHLTGTATTTAGTDGLVRFLAEGIVAACHHEMALINALPGLYDRLAGRLPHNPSRFQRSVLADLVAHPVTSGPDLVRRHNMTSRTAVNTIAAFRDAGILLPHGTTKYGRTVYCPAALELVHHHDTTGRP
ncbi:hypothetical protein [Saccharothrix violaceirubra]|uniref:Fic family protein n=1 Tax=Saccharothrix violaceirubra TaxID=413306 RepID=A0A7W7WYV9_9PSEU|nr:hypothetical protein [Saccharothrix violaceirubra]MBB4968642.1 hypothetical protein [Saccharothrix violaceirubra]